MTAQNNDYRNKKKIRKYFEYNRSGWWKITDRWFLVKNSKNASYLGPSWAKHLYDLVYIPEKGIFDKGHREEIMNAENTKKQVYVFLTLGILAIIFILLARAL